MKQLSILFLSALTLGLTVTSCDDEDDKPSIEGKWELSQIGGGIEGGEEEVINPNEGSTCSAPTIEFLKNNQLITTSSNPTEGACETFSANGRWTREGNAVTIYPSAEDDENQQKYEIKELTKDKLKLYISITEEGVTTYQFLLLTRK